MKYVFVILLMLVAINTNAQWQPDVRLTNNPASSYTSSNNAWCVAANGNVVHVVWTDFRDVNSEIYYKRSTDAGINWGSDTRLTNSASASEYPSLAVSGSVVHIVWHDLRDGNAEIYYKRSTDTGVNWGADTRLTNNTFASYSPSVTLSGSDVHVVWYDERNGLNGEIYYKRSTDAGVSWGTDTRLTNNTAESRATSATSYGSVVHVVWEDRRDGNREIYYKRSTDAGVIWGTDTRLTNNTANSECPSIAVSGSNLHVVWFDNRDGNYEIYYKRSTDGGINWGADTRLTNYIFNSWGPSVAVAGAAVHVVWVDYRDGKYEIYYKRSTDTGLNWVVDTRLTNNSFNTVYPSVAVSGSAVHVVWYDERDGNPEIYYKRNPTGNVGIQNISTEIPSSFSLSQNYPNPFNPETKIRFSIKKTENGKQLDTKLVIYDALGREIETLVNDVLQPGTYEVTFDARLGGSSGLNTGVYFYRLVSDGFIETKRMLLIK